MEMLTVLGWGLAIAIGVAAGLILLKIAYNTIRCLIDHARDERLTRAKLIQLQQQEAWKRVDTRMRKETGEEVVNLSTSDFFSEVAEQMTDAVFARERRHALAYLSGYRAGDIHITRVGLLDVDGTRIPMEPEDGPTYHLDAARTLHLDVRPISEQRAEVHTVNRKLAKVQSWGSLYGGGSAAEIRHSVEHPPLTRNRLRVPSRETIRQMLAEQTLDPRD
jgi:hypothetical protein